jgi:hypothetical protein
MTQIDITRLGEFRKVEIAFETCRDGKESLKSEEERTSFCILLYVVGRGAKVIFAVYLPVCFHVCLETPGSGGQLIRNTEYKSLLVVHIRIMSVGLNPPLK